MHRGIEFIDGEFDLPALVFFASIASRGELGEAGVIASRPEMFRLLK